MITTMFCGTFKSFCGMSLDSSGKICSLDILVPCEANGICFSFGSSQKEGEKKYNSASRSHPPDKSSHVPTDKPFIINYDRSSPVNTMGSCVRKTGYLTFVRDDMRNACHYNSTSKMIFSSSLCIRTLIVVPFSRFSSTLIYE